MQEKLCPCVNPQNNVKHSQQKGKQDSKILPYESCCKPFHDGLLKPETPEQLMRSRYSAFYLANGQYIYDSHHPDYRGNTTVSDYSASAESTKWVRLEVINSTHQNNSYQNSHGQVEFKAFFIEGDKLHCFHEVSNFETVDEQWLYTDGDYRPKKVTKIARNELCPCGSGDKAKKCCLSSII